MTDRSHRPQGSFCRRTRREFFWEAGGSFTGLALSGLLDGGFYSRQTRAADGVTAYANPLAAKTPMFAPKAKRVIFLFMYGGPSHVDTFDYKPELYPLDGKVIKVKTKGRGGERSESRAVGPKWKFKQYGQCGKWVSDLFPHIGQHVDDIAFIHSMTADSPIHGSAMLQMNSGKILSGSPCLGSWVNYGLGSVNENLPGFVVMLDKKGGPISGAKNWSSGYMPATYQATLLRSQGDPILNLAPPDDMPLAAQRALLDSLRDANTAHLLPRGDNSELAARIASYELAWRMQEHAPERKSTQLKILSIEDDPEVRSVIAEYLSTKGYDVLEAEDGESGLKIFSEERPDLVLLDILLPGMDGLEVLGHISKDAPDIPVIIVSGKETIRVSRSIYSSAEQIQHGKKMHRVEIKNRSATAFEASRSIIASNCENILHAHHGQLQCSTFHARPVHITAGKMHNYIHSHTENLMPEDIGA